MNSILNFMLGQSHHSLPMDVIAKLGKTGFNKCHFYTYIMEIGSGIKKNNLKTINVFLKINP